MARCLSCQRELSAPVAVCPFCGAESATAQFNEQLLDQVLSLLAKNQKLEAIKLIKTSLRLSLMDAKTAVDRLEAEQFTPAPAEQPADEKAWHAGARDLLLQGKKLQAIKLCRDHTGCGLKDAADQVEALALRLGINPRRGCFGVVLVALALLVGAASLVSAW